MKTVHINYAAFAGVVLMLACNKLVENPSSTIISPQFYKTQSDGIAAVNAI